MFNMGIPELILILVIGLVIFGPGKLPEIGRAVGKSINEFKNATTGLLDDSKNKPPATPREAASTKEDVVHDEIKSENNK